jgi:hypothetical protein
VIPRTIIVVAERFSPQLSAARVAAAIARGLRAAGLGEVESVAREDAAIPATEPSAARGRAALGPPGPQDLRDVRALVLADPELCNGRPPREATFELATRARQGGVPAYAVCAVREPDLFEARVLDLQVVLSARGLRSLESAAARLAKLL